MIFNNQDNPEVQVKHESPAETYKELIFPTFNTSLSKELSVANERIKALEMKLMSLETRVPKPFPNVKFLNYRTKKRILVSNISKFDEPKTDYNQ